MPEQAETNDSSVKVEYRVRVVPKSKKFRCAWVRCWSVTEARSVAASWLVAVRRSMAYPDLRPADPGDPNDEGEFGRFNPARAVKFRQEAWPWVVELEQRTIDDDNDEDPVGPWEQHGATS